MWLWFDVEEGYNTTTKGNETLCPWLWFDVEEGYNTTEVFQRVKQKWVVV